MSSPHTLADHLLRDTRPDVRASLERALEGRELGRADVLALLGARGRDLQVLCMAADVARREDVGDEVSYVVNRNINSTNVCYVGCSFCGFARHKHDEDAYDRPLEDILRRAHEAWEKGASELCIQGGIHPNKDGFWYQETIAAIKAELPDIHIHGVSPEEIHWGHQHSNGMALEDYLKLLHDTGLGTVPGTAAEILDDEVRRVLSPRKLMTERWVEIVRTAHKVGLRTSSTLMYGHIETPEHIATHLELLRDLQKDTGGFTEFVPLGFIHSNTRLYKEQGARAGASMPEDLALVAIGRLFFRPWITNIQVSWVKMGKKLAQVGLMSGANDFGGTLMEESISRAAGSEHGDCMEAGDIERHIREIGRVPYERTTTYGRRERPLAADAGLVEIPLHVKNGRPPISLGSGY
jgi:7,8-didemethyl-8-hydroxy-5-deazariboflavin synthase CofH subunit